MLRVWRYRYQQALLHFRTFFYVGPKRQQDQVMNLKEEKNP
jgi:hypothetical protein